MVWNKCVVSWENPSHYVIEFFLYLSGIVLEATGVKDSIPSNSDSVSSHGLIWSSWSTSDPYCVSWLFFCCPKSDFCLHTPPRILCFIIEPFTLADLQWSHLCMCFMSVQAFTCLHALCFTALRNGRVPWAVWHITDSILVLMLV